MPKTKVSVTVDAVKVAQARELLAGVTLSQLIDVALDRLILDELERRHVAGYTVQPPGPDDAAWADVERNPHEIADDVDWAQLYGVKPSP